MIALGRLTSGNCEPKVLTTANLRGVYNIKCITHTKTLEFQMLLHPEMGCMSSSEAATGCSR